MKSKAVVSAILAMSLSVAGFSFAQGSGLDPDRNAGGRDGQGQRNAQTQRNGQMQRNAQQARRDQQARQQNRWQNQGRANNYAYQNERGAGPDHQFYRGGRLPPQYRSRQYVVNDWRGHHLNAPPRGYHWVQTGGDYVLVAIATGVILQILLSQ